jgi:hypothetical protein
VVKVCLCCSCPHAPARLYIMECVQIGFDTPVRAELLRGQHYGQLLLTRCSHPYFSVGRGGAHQPGRRSHYPRGISKSVPASPRSCGSASASPSVCWSWRILVPLRLDGVVEGFEEVKLCNAAFHFLKGMLDDEGQAKRNLPAKRRGRGPARGTAVSRPQRPAPAPAAAVNNETENDEGEHIFGLRPAKRSRKSKWVIFCMKKCF